MGVRDNLQDKHAQPLVQDSRAARRRQTRAAERQARRQQETERAAADADNIYIFPNPEEYGGES